MIKANRIGFIGITIALLGIVVAMFQDDIRVKFTPESPKLVEQVTTKGLNLFGIETSIEESHDKVDFLYMGLGLIGLVLGVGSYLIKENHRVSGVAGALGIVAIAWQYVLIGVAFAVVLFFLAIVS